MRNLPPLRGSEVSGAGSPVGGETSEPLLSVTVFNSRGTVSSMSMGVISSKELSYMIIRNILRYD